jgi:arylsulfatase A-like enzyme
MFDVSSRPLVVCLLAFAACGPEVVLDPHGDPLSSQTVVTETDPVGGTTPPPPPPGGNVLLLVADDVGVDKISGFGVSAADVHTPNLDLMLATGTRFTNAWSLPTSGAASAALQTGRFPRRTGHGGDVATDSGTAELDSGQITIAEVAAASPAFDYTTAYVGRWQLSTFLSPSGTTGPRVQGWGSYAGPLGNLSVWEGEPPQSAPGYYLWQKVTETGELATVTTYATTDVVDDAVNVLATLPEPWILQVTFNAAHAPYDLPPPDLVTTSVGANPDPRTRQRLIVEALDAEIGRLFEAIPVLVRPNTTVIFLGDNGTVGGVAEDEIDATRAFGSVYEPTVRVPLVVSGPLVASRGSSSPALVHVVDVLPTIAEIVGTDLSTFTAIRDSSQPLAVDGDSLVPLLADPDRTALRDVSYTERFSPVGPAPYDLDVRAVRDSKYKLVFDAVAGEEQFFEYPLEGGGTDEGPDVMVCGLTAQQSEAYVNLRDRMVELVESMDLDAEWDAEAGVPDAGAPVEPLLDLGCD